LLLVTRHPGGPPGRPKIHPALPLRAFLHCAAGIYTTTGWVVIWRCISYDRRPAVQKVSGARQRAAAIADNAKALG
jgi:hypothetical protein